jgi:hypothetical protein
MKYAMAWQQSAVPCPDDALAFCQLEKLWVHSQDAPGQLANTIVNITSNVFSRLHPFLRNHLPRA